MTKSWPYGVLLLEVLVFFRHVIFRTAEYVIPWDFRYYAFNQATFLADSLRHGSFPLWDPYTYCGMAFYTNIQSQVFYPPTLVTALVSNLWDGGHHLMLMLTLQLALHVLFAGVCTYWLLRAMACAEFAALIGATAFQLGCYFASQTQHLGAIDGGAWLPLSALAVIKLAELRCWRWIAILSLSLALPILAGYPSAIWACFFCSAVLAAALVVTRNASWRLLVSYAGACAWSFAIAAIQLIPTLEITRLSVSRYRGDWRGAGSGLRLEALASLLWPNWHHILDLHGYTLPYNFTFLYIYCGLITLVLAVIGLRRRTLATPFAILTLASAVLMFGDSSPIGRTLLPWFFDLVHDSVYPEFTMLGFSLGLAVLAAIGADRLRNPGWLLPVLLVAMIFDLTYAGSGRPMNTMATKREAGITPDHFDGNTELLATVRGLVDETNPPSRMETYNDVMGWTSMSPTIRIPTGNGNDPFALIRFMNVRRLFCGGERWGRYYEVAKLGSPVIDLLNTRFIVSHNTLPPSSSYHLKATLTGGHVLYENRSALPRFFLVRHTRAVSHMEEGLALMRAGDYKPDSVAVVEGALGLDFPEGTDQPVGVMSYEQNEAVVSTRSTQDRFLVTSEANYPGWHAYLDGTEVPIVQTNVAFRGLRVPAGEHRITFRFRPAILWESAAITAVAMMAAAWALKSREASRGISTQ